MGLPFGPMNCVMAGLIMRNPDLFKLLQTSINVDSFFFLALMEISKLLNTGLDSESLSICVKLIEAGVNPEALAMVIKELRRESASIQVCHHYFSVFRD